MANAINDYGQVAGSSTINSSSASQPNQHAFLWQPSASRGTTGTTHDLGVLPGHTDSQAAGISLTGQVVGSSYDQSGDTFTNNRASVWTPTSSNGTTGTLSDLNSLTTLPRGVTLEYSGAINAGGKIVGGSVVGTDGSGNPIRHAFVLNP